MRIPIISAISDNIKEWQKGRTRIKTAKVNAQVAKYDAEARLQEMRQQQEGDYDQEALRQSQFSWKDEYLLVVLSAPFIGSFIPGVQDHVGAGWEYVNSAPHWYQLCFMGVIAATFGLRWWFSRTKIDQK